MKTIKEKATLIVQGWEKSEKIEAGPGAYELAEILANLTSSSKEQREWAKAEVRELVKIGEAE